MSSSRRFRPASRLATPILIALLLITHGLFSSPPAGAAQPQLVPEIDDHVFMPVIVTIAVPNWQAPVTDTGPQPDSTAATDPKRSEAIHAATHALLSSLPAGSYQLKRTFSVVPGFAAAIDTQAHAMLLGDKRVTAVVPDEPALPAATYSSSNWPLPVDGVDLIGAPEAWTTGYTGAGVVVAIVDDGIRATHEMFAGKTITEACFSSNDPSGADRYRSVCPGGGETARGGGSAVPVGEHGTHIAGIAAGNNLDPSADEASFGVAPHADIMAVQVFSEFFDHDYCGPTVPCYLSWPSDQIAALEHIYALRTSMRIGAVNLSLSSGAVTAGCDTNPLKPIIDQLRAAGIATVVATGNDGYCGAATAPACISSAIAVGASTGADEEAWFNNYSETMQDIYAPGAEIRSAGTSHDSSYIVLDGSSIAAPHLSGALTLMRQALPDSSLDTLLSTLVTTGQSIQSECGDGDGFGEKPRFNLNQALETVLEPCSYELSAGQSHFDAAGGTAELYLFAAHPGCPVTIDEHLPWLQCAASAEAGDTTVTLTVTPNSGSTRSGSFTVAGEEHLISQSGALCTHTITPHSTVLDAEGGTDTVKIMTRADCPWTIDTPYDWITASPATGTGSDTVTLNIAANSGSPRTAAITVAGSPFSVRQNGRPHCGVTISSSRAQIGDNGGAVTVMVDTGAGCDWSSASSLDWVTVAPAQGSGPGSVVIEVANGDGTPRTGQVSIAGHSFAISQGEQTTCDFTIAPAAATFSARGGAQRVSVTASGAECGWSTTTDVDWVALTPSSGVGSGAVMVEAGANDTGEQRETRITIGGRPFQIIQEKDSTVHLIPILELLLLKDS
jgi:hypothetical protein